MSTKESLTAKLHPNRITGSSDQMYYIMSSILNANWVTHDDGMGSFTVTSDKFVVDCGLFFGDIGEFKRNVTGYVDVADLEPDEEKLFWTMYADRVHEPYAWAYA